MAATGGDNDQRGRAAPVTTPNEAPAADSAALAPTGAGKLASRLGVATAGQVLLLARGILLEYLRSGWILVELAYVLALYLFAFGYPFELPFFFESANWGLGLLAIFATLLLVARAMRPAVAQPASAHTSRHTYIAGVMLAAAALRIVMYVLLLALVLLSHKLINATGGALLAGSLGLLASCSVLAALALALSPAFTPAPRTAQPAASPERHGEAHGGDNGFISTLWRSRHLVVLAWLTAALYSYTSTNSLAALFLAFRLPLLPLFACYAMGTIGVVGWGGLLSLVVDAGYVVGLVLLADSLGRRRDGTPAHVPADVPAVATPAAAESPRAGAPAQGLPATPPRTASRTAPAPRSRTRNHMRSAR